MQFRHVEFGVFVGHADACIYQEYDDMPEAQKRGRARVD